MASLYAKSIAWWLGNDQGTAGIALSIPDDVDETDLIESFRAGYWSGNDDRETLAWLADNEPEMIECDPVEPSSSDLEALHGDNHDGHTDPTDFYNWSVSDDDYHEAMFGEGDDPIGLEAMGGRSKGRHAK